MDGQLAKPLPRTESATSSEDGDSASGARSDAAVAVSSLLEALSVDEAVAALAQLTRLAAEAQAAAALLDAAATSAVTLTMRAFPAPAVQYRCLSALRAFSVLPELRSEVLRAGGLDLTLALMRADPALTVQDRGATIIANLAVGCAHRKRRLAREGAVAAVVTAMTAFPHDVQMQVRGALALRNLAHNAQVNQYIAGKAGAIDAVLDALLGLGRSADKELLYQTIAALESMCTQDKGNRARIIDRDAQAWPAADDLWHDPTRAPLGKAPPPATAADISPVSSASDPNRKAPHPDPAYARFPAPTGQSKSGPLALLSAKAAQNENIVPTNASSPLRRESDLAGNKPRIASMLSEAPSATGAALPDDPDAPSVFRTVLRAVRRAPENRALLKYSLSLLSLTAWKRSDVQYRLGELGAVEVALATVKRYGQDVPLVTRACTLLCTLCLQDANRARTRPGLGVLLRALDANKDSIPATREIAAAISNALYCAPQNRLAVLERDGARAVSDAILRVDARDVRVLEAGLCTLRNLVDGTREGAERCAAEQAIAAARAALDATKEAGSDAECRVQTQAVLLLGDMAKCAPETAKQMIELEVADWVENALAKLDKGKHREAHVVGDELLLALQDPAMFSRAGHSEVSDDTGSYSFSFSGRWQTTRGIFSSISLRQSRRASSTGRRRRSRRSNASGKAPRRDEERPAEAFFGRRWPLGCP